MSWVKKLKKNVKSALTGKAGHSKAGKNQLEYEKAVKKFSADIKKDNLHLSDKEARDIAEDELSGAHEKREKRKARAKNIV